MGIRQLAQQLQLSIGTVSRALNDRPDVNPETRARVKEAAARAGYVPDQSGRSLRSGRTGIVAAVIPTRRFATSSDAGLLTVLEGVQRTLRKQALDLIVLFRGPDEDPLENLQRIVQRRIADAVIISETEPLDPRLTYLKAAGVDYVCFGRSAGLENYPFVDFDFETMAAEAFDAFVAAGHRRLALALGDRPQNYEIIATEVFRAAARRIGLGEGAVRLLPLADGHLTGQGRALFAAGARGPTAVLATHECIAATLYADFAEMGLAVGGDVSVACTFPALGTRNLMPALTHFDADLDAVGVALAEQLLAPEGPSGEASTLVPLSFVPRASLRPARAPVGA